MKSKVLNLILLFFLLLGCQLNNQKPQTGDLPVIDLSKNYPKKEIRLQDIADIENIALETTDDILLSGGCNIAYISDKHIVIRDIAQSTFYIFNQEGKIINYFNRRGQGPQEWVGIAQSVFDEKNEEIYVKTYHTILVYSLNGEYKRTLPLAVEYALMDILKSAIIFLKYSKAL